MKLYGYFRSSAAYRIRIVLNLKGIAYEDAFVHLTRGGGEQFTDAYAAVNPQKLVPTLVDEGVVLTQSLAIVEYLEETHPMPPVLPADPPGRARVRALAQAIACDIHPINNLRVLNYLTGVLGVSQEHEREWYRHWISEGFQAVEHLLAGSVQTGRYSHGDNPSVADAFLVPQVYNARRFEIDLLPYPTIMRIDAACLEVEAFRRAQPEMQADAQPQTGGRVKDG